MHIERIACVEELHNTVDGTCTIDMIMDESVKAAAELAKTRPESVQLIYIDPPFNTGREFRYRQRAGESGYKGNTKNEIAHVAYTDRFQGGKPEYLHMMRGVLVSAHRLLDEKGSIYVHVDYRTSAHIRLLLDEIFGEKNFINEIIWHYKSGGRAVKHFSRKHDTIFFYKKGAKYRFDPLAASKPRGKERRNHLRRQTDENGRTFFSIRSNGKIYRYYEDTPVYASDVWHDIPHLQQRDPERTLYDTQKPIALLERIIGVSSEPGGVVADLFCGSGTTLEAAARIGRKSIGIDASAHALNICRKRLHTINASFRCVYGAPAHTSPVRLHVTAGKYGEGRTAVQVRNFSIPIPENGFALEDCRQEQLSWLQPGAAMQEGVFAEPGAVDEAAGIGALDYIALGFIENGVFYTVDAHTRSSATPALRSFYNASFPPGAQTALHLTDILGQNHYFKLTL